MIGEPNQGKEYGRRVVELLIERIHKNGNPKFLLTSHLPGDDDAGKFYENSDFSIPAKRLVMAIE